MNWLNSQKAIDANINKSIYAGLSKAEGIDLRIEMHSILYGGLGRVPKGHWVIYRKYDRTKPSKFYDKQMHEGVGGPAFEYTDTLLRTRQVPVGKSSDASMPTKAGIDLGDSYVYYFEYSVNVAFGDEILELGLTDHRYIPDINTAIPQIRYKIDKIHPYRLEDGSVQYWLVVAKLNEVTH